MKEMIRFNDIIHEETKDGFKVGGHGKKQCVQIFQEFDSGNVICIYLSFEDIEQMYLEMKGNMLKLVK